MLTNVFGRPLDEYEMDELSNMVAIPLLGYQGAIQSEPDLKDEIRANTRTLIQNFLEYRYDVGNVASDDFIDYCLNSVEVL